MVLPLTSVVCVPAPTTVARMVSAGRNSRSRQNMQTTARRKKRQRTQSRALTVVLLAVVLLGLLVRAWTMGLMK